MRSFRIIALMLFLTFSCRTKERTETMEENSESRPKASWSQIFNLDSISNTNEVIYGENGGLLVTLPKNWSLMANEDNLLALEFNFLSDTGYFRIVRFPDSLHATELHEILISDLSTRADKISERDCLDSLTSDENQWLIFSQSELSFGVYERYITEMYISYQNTLFQYVLLLPDDGSDGELGKYILGQILFHSEYNGNRIFESHADIKSQKRICN